MRKIAYIPLTTPPERFVDYSIYKELFGYDDSYQFYGAFYRGQQVGYGATKDGEIVHISAVDSEVDHGLNVFLQQYGNAAILAKSKGKDPKDLINAPIPFIYDVHKNHIQIGFEGEKTRDIKPYRGEFSKAAIVEGEYQPGGKMIIYPSNTALYTTRSIQNCWISQFPQMEITSLEIEHEGKTHKVGTAGPVYYHVTTEPAIESIQQHGLDNTRAKSAPWDNVDDWDDGVYLWDNLAKAQQYAQEIQEMGHKPVIYQVNGAGLQVQPDNTGSQQVAGGWYTSYVDPMRLRRVGSIIDAWNIQNTSNTLETISSDGKIITDTIVPNWQKEKLTPFLTNTKQSMALDPNWQNWWQNQYGVSLNPQDEIATSQLWSHPFDPNIKEAVLGNTDPNVAEWHQEMVPVSQLVPTQEYVTQDGVKHALNYPDSHPIIGAKDNKNRTIVQDGHHGASAAIMKNEPSVLVNVLHPYTNRWSTTSGISANQMDPGQFLRVLTSADPAASLAYDALRFSGGKVYVVGGAVRDVLRGENPKDLDLMVAGLPTEEIDNILSKLPGRVDLTGKRFGVYRYRHDGHEVEIALPRQDKYETSRRGEGVITVDHNLPIDKDLERRDFTVNSMAVDLDTGDIIDPHGGQNDLEKNLLRTTHPDSFREDPTRLVRALTAHSRFGLHPDEQTRGEMAANAHLLRGESSDALNKQIDKLIGSHNPAAAIRLAHDTGILKHIFPEVDDNWDFDQSNPHHKYPLGDHLMHVLGNTSQLTPDPDVRMAAMLHDIGKPASAWKDPVTNHNHYYEKHLPSGEVFGADHEHVGAKMAEDRLRHLNYPVARIKRVQHLVSNHMFPAFDSQKGARKFLNRVGDEHADDLLNLRQADMGDKGQDSAYYEARTPVDQMRTRVDEVRKGQQPTDLNNLAINGNDLIGMGMPQGAQIGQTLRNLLDLVIEQPTLNNHNDLMNLAKQYM
jgi:tRNA nucleotidyltransferase (CCA-adding enzyme)